MADTTPHRRAELLALHPELAAYARVALRLHPRRGTPKVGDSSVGGPLAWPLSEPWPTCSEDHAFDEGDTIAQGAAIEDVRRILNGEPLQSEAELRRLDPGAAAALTRMMYGHDAPAVAPQQLSTVDTVPDLPVVMASVLQLYRRDVPDAIAPLPEWMFPDGTDLLQVLWCPNPHADDYEPRVRLYWRTESGQGAGRQPRVDPLHP